MNEYHGDEDEIKQELQNKKRNKEIYLYEVMEEGRKLNTKEEKC